MNRIRLWAGVAAMLIAALGCCSEALAKDKVFLSMSYIGNDWQAEAANMARAMALHRDMKDQIDFEVQVAGPNAQKQIQQIHAMVQAGAKAIVVYPISPTALNQVVKEACDKGVVIFAYDAEITEPCAHNVHIDQSEAGRAAAEWLAQKLGGKGNIVYISGVPGTSTDSLRTKASMEVLAKYPDIKVVAQGVGMWSQAVARTEMTKIVASHPWNQIDGVLVQAGCYSIYSMQKEAGIPDDKLKYCSGEASNGDRLLMLPASMQVAGEAGTYRPMGAPGFSYASPPVSGALALKLAVQAMHGTKFPHDIVVPLPQVTNDNVKLCKEGTWAEMKSGCNVFAPSVIKNPGWFAEIFNPQTPEVGLAAALDGQPEK
jgi:ribose transport system substrate-binding protein